MEEVIHLTITSRLEDIARVESLMESIKIKYDISDEQYGNILLASVEAVTNAMEHGNLLNQEKTVYIEAQKSEHELRLYIKDQGSGFNFETLPDPTSEQFLEQPNGRGVFLIKQLADEVYFRDNGALVEMRFILT